MCFYGGGGSSNAARQAEAQRQQRIQEGMGQINNTFAPFDDNYYKDYESKYIAASRPDLEKQQRDANQDVLFGLARQGKTRSSSASKAYSDVADTRVRTDLQVADQAREASSNQRNQIEATRSNLVSQLNATADAQSAADGARVQAQLLNRVPTYSPITNAFSEVTNQFAINEQNRRNGSPGWGWGLTTPVDPIRGSSASVRNVA
jgi:hypothetical protein